MEKQVTTTERTEGDKFIRECSLPARGDFIRGHTHKYDHLTKVISGTAKIISTNTKNEVEEHVIEAPGEMMVKAGVLHSLEALTGGVVIHCVFQHRDKHGNVTDEPNAREAYI